jgi:hypothetical protein
MRNINFSWSFSMIAENQPLSPQSFEQQQNPETEPTAPELLAIHGLNLVALRKYAQEQGIEA